MDRTEPLGVRVSPDLKTVLVKAAKAEDRSLASLVERVLTEWTSGAPNAGRREGGNAVTTQVEADAVNMPDGNRPREDAVDPRTETPGMSERDLLESAVRLALPHRGRGRGKHPRWVAVMDTFALGSGYAHALCRRFGFDPHEKVGQ